jgi:predicted RNA binding protein YcfA (HicA-like mRNA interferase family)
MMLVHPDYQWTISVPDHRELGVGLLSKLVKQAGLSVAEFNAL